MDELTRLRYLEKMGVDVYNARFPLPAAKASTIHYAAVDPSATGIEAAAASGKPKVSKLVSAGVDITSAADIKARFFDENGMPKIAATAADSEPAEASQPAVNASDHPKEKAPAYLDNLLEEGQLILPLFQPLPSVLVLNQQGALGNTHLRLLRAIFFALGKVSEINGPVRQFEWRREAAKGICVDDVRERLLAFIEGFQFKYGSRYLLLMGEAPTRLVVGDAIYPSLQEQFHNLEIITLPGLQDMIENPVRKRDAWQALSPFAGNL